MPSGSRQLRTGPPGPDSLWALTESHRAMIEMKTGITRDDSEILTSETGHLSVSHCPLTRNQPVTQADQHGKVEETQEVRRVLPSARVTV